MYIQRKKTSIFIYNHERNINLIDYIINSDYTLPAKINNDINNVIYVKDIINLWYNIKILNNTNEFYEL